MKNDLFKNWCVSKWSIFINVNICSCPKRTLPATQIKHFGSTGNENNGGRFFSFIIPWEVWSRSSTNLIFWSHFFVIYVDHEKFVTHSFCSVRGIWVARELSLLCHNLKVPPLWLWGSPFSQKLGIILFQQKQGYLPHVTHKLAQEFVLRFVCTRFSRGFHFFKVIVLSDVRFVHYYFCKCEAHIKEIIKSREW